MDVIRGTAVLLIIAFHAMVVAQSYGDLAVPQWLIDTNYVITPLRIPLLVLLSGMLLGSSLRKGARRFFEGKARNIAWPYVVWAVLWGAASWPVFSLIGYALGGSYLWFLIFLTSFYCVAWVVRGLPPEVVILVSAVASAAATALTPGESTYAERWPYLFAVFMLGHLLTVRPAVQSWVLTSRWAYAVPVVLLALHLGFSLGYDYGLESSLFMAAGAVVVMRLARRVGSAPVLRPLRFVGRKSLVYYVSHYPFMVALTLAATSVATVSALALIPALFVAAVVVATGLAALSSRAPVSWLFTAPGGRRPTSA